MKQSFSALLFLVFIIPALAQKREYVDQAGNKTKKKSAVFYRTVTEVTNNDGELCYFVQTYSLTDTLRKAGYYKDKKHHVRDGTFLIFGKNGLRQTEATYIDGVLNGPYKTWYDDGRISEESSFLNDRLEGKSIQYYESGSPKLEHFFRNGELHGEITEYYENGNPGKQQTFADGKKTGKSFNYYENGQPEGEENYTDGMLQGEARWYFPNGKLSSVEQYDADTLVSFELYNEDGTRDTISQTPGEAPEFPGGMKELKMFLANNIRYPQFALEYKLEGKVYLMFTITAKGEIRDIETVAGLPGCPECDEEAIRVVKMMPNWTPGKMHNHYTDVHYALPVIFALN